MSATYPDPALDRQEQLIRMDRLREEALKFAAEQHKLTAEMLKFSAKQQKLAAEASKFGWDRYVTLGVALVSALVAVASLLRR